MKALLAATAFSTLLLAQADPIVKALSEHRFDEALRSTDSVLQSRPNDARLWMLRGAALHGLHRDGESLAAYRKAVQLQPKNLGALQAVAQLEYSGKDPAASKTLTRILDVQPDNEIAQAMSGVVAFEAKDCAGAVRHFEKALRQIEQQKASLEEYGYCLMQQNRAADAVPVLEKILAADPADSRAKLNLVLALSAAGRPAEGIPLLQALSDQPDPDPDVFGLLGELYRANNQVPEAIAAYRRGIDRYPKEERLYIGLAALCSYYNSGELGLEIVQLGLKNLSDSSRLYAMRGVLNAQLGKNEESFADFRRAAALSPDEQVGSAGIAASLLQEDRVDELIAMMRQRLRQKPGDAAAGFQLAQALLRKGAQPSTPEYQEAAAVLERSVRADPQSSAARALLGKIYFTQGKRDQAIRELETALKLQPDNRTAMYQLMLSYQAADRVADAKRLQERMKQAMQDERDQDLQRSRIRLTKTPEEASR
jgi:cytochrome c-type biogenesis protein CcmH/NrfG